MTDENSDITRSTKVSSFARDNNLIAGINALPFDIVTSREGQPVKNMGLVISDGKLLSSANPYYDALVFYKDRSAEIVAQSAIESIENIENAAGGFHKILADGEPAQRTENREERHPRSAAGVSANAAALYLLVIDGRRADSIGGTEKETALLLHALGSWNGINFDGGGSSALVMRYSGGSFRVVNIPVHSGIPGRERPVAGCIGVSLSTER
jgi:exopolysaccharide biosynthesis protein